MIPFFTDNLCQGQQSRTTLGGWSGLETQSYWQGSDSLFYIFNHEHIGTIVEYFEHSVPLVGCGKTLFRRHSFAKSAKAEVTRSVASWNIGQLDFAWERTGTYQCRAESTFACPFPAFSRTCSLVVGLTKSDKDSQLASRLWR